MTIYDPMFPNNPEEIAFYKSFYRKTTNDCLTYNYSNNVEDKNVLDIYLITFNNLFCVEYQIKTLNKFLKQKYNLIVIDNNNELNPIVSNKTLELCKKNNIAYVKAPNNLFQLPGRFNPSLKLGTTMNWIYVNCAKNRQSKYFGYLDQDCFLMDEIDLTDHLDIKYMYGPLSFSKKYPHAWNLHVTSNFYNYEYIKNYDLDFRASHEYELDTGGANYNVIYNKLNSKDYEMDLRGFRYFEYDIGDADTFQYYTLHDHKWLHMCGSTGKNVVGVDTKVAYIKGFLDCILHRNDKAF